MTKRGAKLEKSWRELLRESFDFVNDEGGLFALDLEYYTDRKIKRVRCYRLLWTNRLAAETKAGRLLRHEGGVLRTGPISETMSAVAEVLAALRQLREQQRRPLERAAA
jgi:hypothetical protein